MRGGMMMPIRCGALVIALAVTTAAVAGQAPAERFRQLVDSFDRSFRNTSRDNLRELEKLLPRFVEVEYADDAELRGRAEDYLSHLVTAADGEEGEPLRATAIASLGEIARSERAIGFLFDVATARTYRRSMVPFWVAAAIGRMTAPAAVDIVCRLGLGSRRPAMRAIALEGLAQLEDAACLAVVSGFAEAILAELDGDRPAHAHAAARVVGRVGLAVGATPLRELSRHDDPMVRTGAAFGLGFLQREPHVRARLAELLQTDPHLGVRETAVHALLRSGELAICEILVPRLRHERRRVAVSIYDGLRELSGLDLDDRPGLWEDWWKVRRDEPARPPVPAPAREGLKNRYAVTYYGVPVHSDRVLFVLDISMSMRYGGNQHEPARIDTAKFELNRVLEQLRPGTRFNVMVFSTGLGWLQRGRLLDATPANRRRARRFVDGLVPAGGTNTYAALKAGLEKFDEVDTVFFLSDGRPSRGMLTDPEALLAKVGVWNARRRVRINTIALVKWDPMSTSYDLSGSADDAARFMEQLARIGEGTFVRHDD